MPSAWRHGPSRSRSNPWARCDRRSWSTARSGRCRRDGAGLSVPLPPIGAFVGPSRIALLLAAPVWLVIGLQAALAVAVLAFAYRFMHDLGDRAGFSIGEGFLPYRARLAWPQGVQEDDDVRWNWSAARAGGARS